VSTLDTAWRVWRESGLGGFYRGLGSTIGREIPFTIIQFPLYEHLKYVLASHHPIPSRSPSGKVRDLKLPDTAACGSVAGAVAACTTTPLDVAKTRIMLSGSDSAGRAYPTNAFKTIWLIYVEEGFSALFKGVVPRTTWIGLGGAVFLGVYEAAKRALGGLELT